MSYSLIIADDEEPIREGLNDLVDWDELGFHVVARLEDGQDIMNWIEDQPVDVILTDIKMSTVSGMEVAAHIFNKGLSTKIVLISGYQEFELAKQAIGCKVFDYLIKPTQFEEISHVLRNVKRKLDEERANSEQLLRLKSQSDELLLALKIQHEEIKDFPTSKSYLVWTEGKRKFLLYVRANNFEIMADRYAALLDEAMQEAVPIKMLHSMLIELSSTLSHSLSSLGLSKEAFALQLFDVSRILALDGLPACKQWGISQLEGIAEHVQHHQPIGQSALINKAKEYAAFQFDQDKDFSLKAIAEHVFLSPDYFSRLFKQCTGCNFTDFIMELRMKRAMEYLKMPQYKVYEIGPLIGYSNAKYFFKMFKKHTGYTPSDYRRKFSLGHG